MKRTALILSFILLCVNSFAQIFQLKTDFLQEITHYNPAVKTVSDGAYLKLYSQYALKMPALSGKNPLDIDVAFMLAKGNNAAFGSLVHDGYSYFNTHSVSLGYNHVWKGLGNGHHSVSLGGRFILGLNNIDFSKLAYGDSGKKMLYTPDLDFGFEYTYKFFHLGASIKNLVSTSKKYDGIEYVRWPRAYFLHMVFDADIVKDKFTMVPYLLFGYYQGIYSVFGLDFRLFKNFRINYSFRVPDLHSNVNVGVNIASWVDIHAGYSLSSQHKYSYVNLSFIIKLKNF